MAPLSGVRVWEFASTPAVAFAGLGLAELGARVESLEPTGGHALRDYPPFADGESMTFRYLTQGKTIRPVPAVDALDELQSVHVLLIGTPALPAEWTAALRTIPLPERGRVIVSCTPYGNFGPKSDWKGSELTLFQAGGEGYLTPSGLSFELFPDRAPTGMGRYLGNYQSGLTVALVALAGLRLSRVRHEEQRAEVSMQAAQLSLNHFVVNRFIDGVLERRANRAFTYGGVLPCADGFVEVVPIEQHQWEALRAMLGEPEWTREERFSDGILRAQNGAEINQRLRAWAAERTVAEVIGAAREHSVPCGAFNSPERLSRLDQFRSRRYFATAHRDAPAAFPGPPWTFDRWPRARSAGERPMETTSPTA